MEPLEWGRDRSDNMLLPMKTHLQPAPDDLLKIIRCQCKSNCDSKIVDSPSTMMCNT